MPLMFFSSLGVNMVDILVHYNNLSLAAFLFNFIQQLAFFNIFFFWKLLLLLRNMAKGLCSSSTGYLCSFSFKILFFLRVLSFLSHRFRIRFPGVLLFLQAYSVNVLTEILLSVLHTHNSYTYFHCNIFSDFSLNFYYRLHYSFVS